MVACLTEIENEGPADWVEEHGDYLYNYAFGQLRNEYDAQDLVQETFLAALKSRDRFNGNSTTRTWLVSILRHKICDYFRRKYHQSSSADLGWRKEGDRFDDTMLWVHEVAAECVSPSRRIDLTEFRQSLEIALHQLPPRIAQAFSMYEIDECAGAEVCRRMNISANNLWTMVHRARKQLRDLLPNWRAEINDVL